MAKHDWDKIQIAYDTGLTYADLISQFGVCSASIQRARNDGCFKPRPKGRGGQLHRTYRYDWKEIQKKYDEGMSHRALIEHFGVTSSTLRKAVREGRLVSRSVADAMALKKQQGWKPTPMCPEARRALSERQSLNNSGGRCKWFWVGDQHVQGTWERDAGIKLTQLGIEWRKCAGKADIITYVLDGKTRRYTPDFYLPVFDLYLEFKGYWWGNDRAKMDAVLAQHPEKNIAIIEKHQYEALFAEETDINVHDIFRQS